MTTEIPIPRDALTPEGWRSLIRHCHGRAERRRAEEET